MALLARAQRDRVAARPRAPGDRAGLLGGLSQSEISEFLDVPLGTVKTRTRSALARLADQLEEEMQMSDRFDELVGDIEDPAERERLRRVHELLLSVEAPPERPAAPAPAPIAGAGRVLAAAAPSSCSP